MRLYDLVGATAMGFHQGGIVERSTTENSVRAAFLDYANTMRSPDFRCSFSTVLPRTCAAATSALSQVPDNACRPGHAQQSMHQRLQYRGLLRHHDAARGIAVEPVHQFQVFRLRLQQAQAQLDIPTLSPLPPCTASPEGCLRIHNPPSSYSKLVIQQSGPAFGTEVSDVSPFRDPARRISYTVARLDPVVAAHPMPFDADFMPKQGLVDAGFRYAFQLAQIETAFQPLTSVIPGDFDETRPGS